MLIAATVTAGAALLAATPVYASPPAPAQLPPLPPASSFGSGMVNPYFPLVPRTTSVFSGVIDGVAARETFTVTDEITVIQGVPANVVRDQLYLEREDGDGRYLAEDTTDWYATANNGDVWYLGEATAEFDEHGQVLTTDGSWQAGVDGARAGIFMPATPEAGASYQQEAATDAQDLFKIISVDDTTVTTREWTPLEPGLVTKKTYESGVGMTLEDTVKGANIEDLLLELVRVKHS
jgi:hypothetical protein